MKRSATQEKVVALYLRLNGYFKTGLILHSPNGSEVKGEIDIIGVRFRNHRQPDRFIPCKSALKIPKNSNTDVVVGEVKGKRQQLVFNESLREHPDRLEKVLKWIGLFKESDLKNLINQFLELIKPKEIQSSSSIPSITHNRITLRPLLFAPDRPSP